MAAIKPETLHVGLHEFWFVPPDRIHFVMRDVFDVSQAVGYLDFIHSRASLCGGMLYASYDLSQLGRLTAEARLAVIKVDRPYPLAGLGIIGASFTIRSLTGMLMSAGRLLAPKAFGFPCRCFETLDEADAWFEELRAKNGPRCSEDRSPPPP